MSNDADATTKRPGWSRPRLFVGIAAITVAAAATFAVAGTIDFRKGGPTAQEKRLLASLEKSLPNTKINAVSCAPGSAPRGFCEFVAGRNVFYASEDGRFVLLGQILDVQSKVDLTERRAKELASVADAEARIAGRPAEASPRALAAAGPQQPARPAGGQVMKVSLPVENAVVHNPGAKLKLTVFADYSCGFCRRLFQDLQANKDVELTEYPIATLGSESAAKAKQVLCAKNPAAAAEAIYVGGRVEGPSECAEGDRRLKENMAFAQSHGINGTPLLVRRDGATNSGWMPAPELLAWLNGARG